MTTKQPRRGRPPKPERERRVRLTISMAPAFDKALRAEAKRRKSDVSTTAVGILFGMQPPVPLFRAKERKK